MSGMEISVLSLSVLSCCLVLLSHTRSVSTQRYFQMVWYQKQNVWSSHRVLWLLCSVENLCLWGYCQSSHHTGPDYQTHRGWGQSRSSQHPTSSVKCLTSGPWSVVALQCCPCGTRISITENLTIAIEMFSYNFKYFPWRMGFREIWNLNWQWQQRDPVSNFYSLLNSIKIIIVQSEWRVNKKPWVIPCSVSCQIINEIFQSVSLLLNHLWTNSSNTSFIFLLIPYLRSSWKKRVWTCTIKWVLHYELSKVTCTCNSEKCIR